jgi:hypothetical protein
MTNKTWGYVGVHTQTYVRGFVVRRNHHAIYHAHIPTRVNKTPRRTFTHYANRATTRFQTMARRLLKPL